MPQVPLPYPCSAPLLCVPSKRLLHQVQVELPVSLLVDLPVRSSPERVSICLSNGQAYQLLQAAQVVHRLSGECPIGHSLQGTSQVPESERIARELAPLPHNPQALDEAWNEAVEQAGGVPTAQLQPVLARRKPGPPLKNSG
jgi:hypothetical protein